MWSEITSVRNEIRWRGELSVPLAHAAFDRLISAPIESTPVTTSTATHAKWVDCLGGPRPTTRGTSAWRRDTLSACCREVNASGAAQAGWITVVARMTFSLAMEADYNQPRSSATRTASARFRTPVLAMAAER
jgi:hypothetical protein